MAALGGRGNRSASAMVRATVSPASSPEKPAPDAPPGPPTPLNDALADLVAHLFGRCVDPENFYWTALHPTFPAPEHRNAVVKRLGWLNVLDWRNPEIARYDLDLRVPDEWKVAHVLTQLAALEPGNNFLNPIFRRLRDLDPIPGWELPAQWDIERYDGKLAKGIPTEGALVVDYVCDRDNLEARERLGREFCLGPLPRPDRPPLDACTLVRD